MTLKKRSEGDTGEKELPVEKPKSHKKSQESVIIYIVVLFTIVFLLILLSYFMHQRESEDTITSLNEEHIEFREQAQSEIGRLTEENEQLRQRLSEAEEEINALKSEINELKGKE